MGKGRRHVAGSYHAPRTTHYVPVCLTRWGPRVMLVPPHGDGRTLRPPHPHGARPPPRPRMGRMGRRAAPQPRRLLRAPRPVLPVCRAHTGRAVRGGGGRALPALAQACRAGTGAASRRRVGPGGRVRPRGAVARRARGFVLLRGCPASPPAPPPGPLPPPHQPHVPRSAARGGARSGGGRREPRIQT